jgi:hypothetical protein
MLRLAPTLSAAAVLAVMLAAAAPSGAEILFRSLAKNHVAIGLNDAGLKDPVGDAAGATKTIAARGSRTL